jgi:hypothetical protein
MDLPINKLKTILKMTNNKNYTTQPTIEWFNSLENQPSTDQEILAEDLRMIFEPTNIETHFTTQQTEQFLLFQEKNKSYGMTNISGGEEVDLEIPENKKEALYGLWFRMRDKLARMRQLILTNSDGSANESLNDTLNDLSNYSNISIIVNKGEWK